MKVAQDIRVFDVVGVFIPGVLELNLLVSMFFSLYYVARALGFDADLELRAVVGGVMILSYFVSVIMDSWDYRGTELREAANDHRPCGRSPAAARYDTKSRDACFQSALSARVYEKGRHARDSRARRGDDSPKGLL